MIPPTNSGTVIDVTASALTTGSALFVESTGASTGTRNVVDFRQEHASATGSTVLNVLADEGYGVKITSTAANFKCFTRHRFFSYNKEYIQYNSS